VVATVGTLSMVGDMMEKDLMSVVSSFTGALMKKYFRKILSVERRIDMQILRMRELT
jgi:hypothetical protein